MPPLVDAPLFYVMGPSGAGKDSVLARARALLSADASAVFAHRYITRPPEASGENHVALSASEFALRRAHGLFAFHWQAHGNHYGIGREIHAWRKAGLTVVVSGSREHFLNVAGVDPDTYPILITASAERLRERLVARGREDAAGAARRLERSDAYDVHDPRLITISNDGPLDKAAAALVRAIATSRSAPVARLRA
ncbi:MAG: phosphonate metabolism protein/1,5-bisphosphokinase (PRPP-forming) PhnN [Reyranella sp.]|nr:phosphonate metabolism protein/1,5-bisphosphokinase (PRPP-forming) PhnN [Reyranella sp.]